MSYNIVTVILSLFLIVVAINKSHNIERFDSTQITTITSANIAEYIYKVYRVDVLGMQNLAAIAIQLQADGITCPGTINIANNLNVSGNTTISGTLSSPVITSPTITDLYAEITALENECSTLETTINILINKTPSLSADGTSAAFTGTMSAGTATLGATTINGATTFTNSPITFNEQDVRFSGGKPFVKQTDNDSNNWYAITGPCSGRGEGLSVDHYDENFTWKSWGFTRLPKTGGGGGGCSIQ